MTNESDNKIPQVLSQLGGTPFVCELCHNHSNDAVCNECRTKFHQQEKRIQELEEACKVFIDLCDTNLELEDDMEYRHYKKLALSTEAGGEQL